jgi:hypothetical protein
MHCNHRSNVKRKTKITIETKRLTLIRQINKATRVRCPSCDKQVDMMTPDQAAIMFRISTRTIHRMVEEGTAHFTETSDGLLMICVKSLSFRA